MKVIVLLFLSIMLLSLAACSSNTPDGDDNLPSNSIYIAQPEETPDSIYIAQPEETPDKKGILEPTKQPLHSPSQQDMAVETLATTGYSQGITPIEKYPTLLNVPSLYRKYTLPEETVSKSSANNAADIDTSVLLNSIEESDLALYAAALREFKRTAIGKTK